VNTDTRTLSRIATEAVLAVDGVRSVIPPGPSLAVLVRDVRSVLDLPRDGGAVLVDDRADRVRVRAVVTIDAERPAAASLRAARDAIVACLADVVGQRRTDVTVRVVEIT